MMDVAGTEKEEYETEDVAVMLWLNHLVYKMSEMSTQRCHHFLESEDMFFRGHALCEVTWLIFFYEVNNIKLN